MIMDREQIIQFFQRTVQAMTMQAALQTDPAEAIWDR